MRGKKRIALKQIAVVFIVLVVSLSSLNIAYALWWEDLVLEGTVTTGSWNVGEEGSPGFWKGAISALDDTNPNNDKYSAVEIEGWLSDIDDSSAWLLDWAIAEPAASLTCADATACIATGEGGTAKEKFLRQYLAMRLNMASERQPSDVNRDFSSYDTGNFLGLGGVGTLNEIRDAIETLHLIHPLTDAEYTTLKDVCEALATLAI